MTVESVVIIGAGAGGIRAAQNLRRFAPDLALTIVAPTDDVVYRPQLIHLPRGRSLTSMSRPVAEFADACGATFRQTAVEGIETNKNRLELSDGSNLAYDRLVIAAGAPADRQRIFGAHEHALFPCDIKDATRLADAAGSGGQGVITIVLSGERIGPGLEYAAHVAALLGTSQAGRVQLRVIDDEPEFLADFGRRGSRYVRRLLTRLGADVQAGAKVAAIEGDHILLADGRRLDSHLTAVVGPLRGPLLGLPATALDTHGFVRCDEFLRVVGHPNIYVVGDSASLTDASDLPKTWMLALRQADTAAANITAEANDETPQPFNLRDARRLAALRLPDLAGTAVLTRNGRMLASGFLAAALRRRVDRRIETSLDVTQRTPTP